MLHQKRKFPRKISYITSPGYINGPNSRQKNGLIGKGPVKVITNLAVLGFDNKSKRMKILSLHPGVSLKKVQENTEFKLLTTGDITTTNIPTDKEIKLIRKIDPNGIYLK